MVTVDARREFELGGADPASTLGPISWMKGDPTAATAPGRFVRATLTPAGAATMALTWSADRAEVEAWGPGADWVVDSTPGLLGLDDDHHDFEPPMGDPLRDPWRRNRGLRLGATGTVWHDLAWFIPQQRVTSAGAARSWGAMVRAWGEPAPGPLDLLLPPAPELIAARHYSDFHRFGIERKRADHLRTAARAASRLQGVVDMAATDARAVLEQLPGIGAWTSTNIAATTLGDRDTVILGDDGIPSMVGWSLAGERNADDARMLELLAPYAPHRWRALRLVMIAGSRQPKRGPKRRNPDIRRL